MSAEPWFLTAEVLLGQIARLVDERNAVRCTLIELGADYELALVRIEQLEHLNRCLDIELYRLRHQRPDRRRVQLLAKAIGAVTLGLIGGVGEGIGTAVFDAWKEVGSTAQQIVIICSQPSAESSLSNTQSGATEYLDSDPVLRDVDGWGSDNAVFDQRTQALRPERWDEMIERQMEEEEARASSDANMDE